jgi:hypothetical protein
LLTKGPPAPTPASAPSCASTEIYRKSGCGQCWWRPILEAPDFQGRTVCSPLNPAEGVWVEPPFEEGRVCIWRASLDKWNSTHPATQAKRQPQQPSPATQPKRKPKRKPRRKAGPGRERIYNHEAIKGAGNRVLARGRPDTKALFFEKVIAECRTAKPKIKLPPNIDVDDSLLRRVVGKLYDDVKDERHN